MNFGCSYVSMWEANEILYRICIVATADDRSTRKSFSPSTSTCAAGGESFLETSGGSPSAPVLLPMPTVTIMVESPQDAPSIDFVSIAQRQPAPATSNVIIDIDTPIDVNVPRDTTNIYYDYASDAEGADDVRLRRHSQPPPRREQTPLSPQFQTQTQRPMQPQPHRRRASTNDTHTIDIEMDDHHRRLSVDERVLHAGQPILQPDVLHGARAAGHSANNIAGGSS